MALVIYSDREELTKEKWDKYIKYAKGRQSRPPMGGIQTGIHDAHWIDGYKGLANDRQETDATRNQESADSE